MTTQPNFVSDLPSVNNNADPVIRSSQQQSEPQNLSSAQPTSEGQSDVPPEVKVLVPAQVAVVAHSFAEQQQQQSVLFQALTAQAAAPHFITLTVPNAENERHEITLPTGQSVSCVQYIDEEGGTGVFSAPNNQMTTFSIYTTPETANMYSPNTSTFYNAANDSENFAQVSLTESQNTGCSSFNEDQDVFNNLDDGSMTESENQLACYPSSRLSAASMKWLVDNYEMVDGMSVPRSTMYTHYLKHCNEQKMEPLNAASFGKLIRMVFNGLRTRRLGTRGNSKYHYYGIRLKPNSTINKAMENIVNTTYRHNEFMRRRLKTETDVKQENTANCNGKRLFEDEGESEKKRPNQSKSHHVYLGDASAAIPEIEVDFGSSVLPAGVTMENVNAFKDEYRRHCEDVLEAVVNFQFSEVESLWQSFWNSSENKIISESCLTRPVFLALISCAPIREFVKLTDYQFYQNLVDVLIPDVLRPIPSTLTQAIRNFAKSLEGWMRAALSECDCDDLLTTKLCAISAFAQTLRRYTSLNHLAQAARAVLQSTTQIKQMTTDLNKVDFRNIQEQASWVCQCEDDSVRRILTEFRETLQHKLWLEDWATWLETIVHQALEPYEGKASYPKAARQFLLKWSFYSSLVIRDLTLRSAASFGSFHLLRLLYDEFMFFVIEHCIAKATGTTSIAVMGEYLCSGEPEQLTDMLEPGPKNAENYPETGGLSLECDDPKADASQADTGPMSLHTEE